MSLLDTRMQNLRSGSNLDKNELRASRYGAYDVFNRMTNDPAGILTPELKEKAKVSIGRLLETPVINYDGGVTIGNTRSITIADSENTSKMYSITFATYSWGFTIVPALFMNNEIAMQRDFETKFNKYLYKFASTMDTMALTALGAAKTQVITDPLNYAVAGNTLGATWSQRENVIGDLDPILSANDYFGGVNLIGNGGVESIINKLAQKGLYNDVNKQLEFAGKALNFTARLTNASGKYATGYAVTDGNLGILTRFERECILDTKMADGTAWGIDTLPMLDMPVGTYYYESKGDFSAMAGAATADMTRVRKEHYGFAVDVAFITPYNSDPANIASPIIKFEVASEGALDGTKVVVTNTGSNPVFTKVAP